MVKSLGGRVIPSPICIFKTNRCTEALVCCKLEFPSFVIEKLKA